MRIAFDISALSMPRSGVGQYQFRLLREMIKMGQGDFFELLGFNFRNRKRLSELDFGEGDYRVRVFPVPHRLMLMSWLYLGIPRIDSIARGSDIYHMSETCFQPVKNGKAVAFVHDLTTLLYPQYHVPSNRFLHNQRFKKLGMADAVLTNSESTKKDIVKHLDVEPEKVHVTYLGADDDFRPLNKNCVQSVCRKYCLNRPYLLFVGTFEPRKNLVNLIKAFNYLKERFKIPHELALVGMKGWKYEDIFDEMVGSRFSDDIRHLGYIPDEDIPFLTNGADVFVYPSLYEGFGLPVLEAMQCGVPVVTSNVSSLPEIGGDACLYADPQSFEEIADKIYSVISDSDMRKKLSEKGIERAKDFSWGKCARKTLSLYRSILFF